MATETTPITTKRCPGVESLGMPAHEGLAAEFGTSKSGKDGLTTRCKVCGNAYGKAWAAARKAGVDFSAKVGNGQAGPRTPTPEERATLDEQRVAVAQEARQLAGPNAVLRKGWTAEVVGGTTYAMPSTEDVGTPEGQAALELLNRARDDERKRRNAEARRAQRAAAKAKKEGAPG